MLFCGTEVVAGWMAESLAMKIIMSYFLISRHVSGNICPHIPTQLSAPRPLLTRPLKQNILLAVIYLFICF